MFEENGLGSIIGALINNRENGNYGWGGNLLWIIVLGFFFLIGGRGGWFGNGGEGPGNFATKDDVFGATAWSRTQNQIEGLGLSSLNLSNQINQNINQQGADIRQELCRDTGTITGGIAQAAFTTQSVGQQIERAIDQSRFENQQQTNALAANGTANAQKILDKLCQMEANAQATRLNELTVANQGLVLQNALGATAQQIISTVRPFPIPSYPVSSPYMSLGFGCGNSWFGNWGGNISYGNFS